MTGYTISFIRRDPEGRPLRDRSTGQLDLRHMAGGCDLLSAKRDAGQLCRHHRIGAMVSQDGVPLVWFLWIESERSVEELMPGTTANEAVATARRRLAANADEARRAGVNSHIHGFKRRGPWRGQR